MKYIAYFFFEDNGIGVEFPDVPGAYACAESMDEALHAARESLNIVLKAMLERGERLPEANTKATDLCMHEIEVDEDIVRMMEDG